MSFSSELRIYLQALGCSAKDLAGASGLSTSTISRYLSDARTPHPGSPAVAQLAGGISSLAEKAFSNDEGAAATSGTTASASDEAPSPEADSTADLATLERLRAIDAAATCERLDKVISGLESDYDSFVRNLNLLMSSLGASNNELAHALNFDSSHISRIRSGKRKPGDSARFIRDTATFISRNYASSVHAPAIAMVTNCALEQASDEGSCFVAVFNYLSSTSLGANGSMYSFLKKLDEFDPNDYVENVRFSKPAAQAKDVTWPTSKTYFGTEGMAQAELDFFDQLLRYRAQDSIIMYSDMPMQELIANKDYPASWTAKLAAALAKGLHLHSIHNVYRPIDEMIMGLELWIPLYMTGNVASYYLAEPTQRHFLHSLRSASTVALYGEAIAGHLQQGRCTLTRSKQDVAYQREHAQQLLASARPLITTFDSSRAGELDRIVQATCADSEACVRIGKDAFRNLEIILVPERYALITKNSSPSLAFLVEHPLLVQAIAAFDPILYASG